MRPLNLKITGFGPYRETNIIDMESLGRGGLYLITGDTGAGKTFIFDAITYALYGDMSGSGRDTKSIRSQYSADGEKSEVELVFDYCGHRYKVTRNPEYNRVKKGGTGFAKQKAGATLIKPDGSVVDGASRVNEEIRNILGIDRGQFCSIAMIAQGEFRKVLNAGTDERQRLFSKLFNTQAYSRLSEELKNLGKRNQDKYDDRLRAIRLCLSSVSCSFSDELTEKLEELKEHSEAEAVPGDICELLGELIEDGKSRASSIKESLEETENRLTGFRNTIALAENHRENVCNLETAKNAIPDLQTRIDAANDALDAANAEKPVIERLENEAALIEASMDSYDELDKISADKLRLEDQLEKKSAGLSDLQNEAEELRNKLNESENELRELRQSGEELIKTGNKIEKTANRVNVLEALIEDIKAVKELSDVLKRQQDDLKPMLTEAERLDAEHSRMLTDYMMEQAGLLAGSLIEGEPCPVCGSVHHPDPAKLSAEAPSADEIEEKKNEAESARIKATEQMGEAAKTKGKLDTLMSSTRDTALRETGSSDLAAAGDAANAEIISLKDSLISMREQEKELKEKAAKAEILNASVPELRESIQEKEDKARTAGKEINETRESLAAVTARYQQIRKDLAYGSKEDAEKNRASKSAEAKKLKDSIEDAMKEVNEASSCMRANDAKISELEKVVAGYEPVDEDAAVEAAAAAETEKKNLTDMSINIASELKSAETALESVRSGARELESIRREHEIIDSLSKTANGMLPGKERITLETYVQSFYFERIIRHANRRLIMMSDGQYEFVRAGESGDKRHLTGLDLRIVDHYSGTERPVNTLSGGESFMASLSLALGLSDEVQSSAGGIRLDTMFVDEGFGSLDSETLEKAIRTLTELSDEDKLVGIISHVEALKSRIDRQIVVTKDRDAGSKATVII